MSTQSEPALDVPAQNAEALLTHWRMQVLNGVITTSVLALVPALGIATYQSLHGVSGTTTGAMLAFTAIVALTGLRFAPIALESRARILIGLGIVLTAAAMLTEGLAPAQFVSVCLLTTLSVLLFSARAAFLVLGTCTLVMAATAYGFANGHLVSLGQGHIDSTNPMNWLRVSLYTMFPSAAAAVGTNHLLAKLRETLLARESLVTQLRKEVVERERAQTQLLHAQKLEAIGQLAAGIAHDFNNTLSVIALEAELLKRHGLQNQGVARGAEALLAAAERGQQLTRQLLLFGRPESGERSVIEAESAFADCAETISRLLPSEMKLMISCSEISLPLRMRASELQQMVLNLAINARDAMPDGGTLEIRFERCELVGTQARNLAVEDGDYARLTCRDTGVGMNEATLARVFEPFFTTKGHGRGTGLGLTNVWNIARLAGGCVQAESKLGQGTTFRVYLPLSDEPPAAAPPRVPSGDYTRGHETVLVVEDDIRIRALLVTTLGDAGYTVLDAQSVDAALVLEREHIGDIDLLCTDVVMPGRPVRELIAEMRARRPRAAILICSGYSHDELIARGVQSGELTLLAKPFTRRALLGTVRSLLSRGRRPVVQSAQSGPLTSEN